MYFCRKKADYNLNNSRHLPAGINYSEIPLNVLKNTSLGKWHIFSLTHDSSYVYTGAIIHYPTPHTTYTLHRYNIYDALVYVETHSWLNTSIIP